MLNRCLLLSLFVCGVNAGPRFMTIYGPSQGAKIDTGVCGDDIAEAMAGMTGQNLRHCAEKIIPEEQSYLLAAFENLVPVGGVNMEVRGRELGEEQQQRQRGRRLSYNHCDDWCGTEELRSANGWDLCCVIGCICELPGWNRRKLFSDGGVSEKTFDDELWEYLPALNSCAAEQYNVFCEAAAESEIIDGECFGCNADGVWDGSVDSAIMGSASEV